MSFINIKNTSKLFGLILITLMFGIQSCKKEEVILVAAITGPTSAMPEESITFSGTGSENAVEYLWISTVPGGETEESTTSTLTFIPKIHGIYTVTLYVKKEGFFDKATHLVQVSGTISLEGTLANDRSLLNLDGDTGTVCDYYISSDLIIPDNVTVTVEEYTCICVDDDVAIIIEQGGKFDLGENSKIRATNNNWKGIYLQDGGGLTVAGSTIDGGGSSSFTSDPNDAANIYTESYLNADGTTLKNSAGHGLVQDTGTSVIIYGENLVFENNALGAGIFHYVNLDNDFYEYNLSAETKGTYISFRGYNQYIQRVTLKHLEDFDYRFLQNVIFSELEIEPGVRIEVADNVGIQVYGLTCKGTFNDPIYFVGETAEPGSWKGIRLNKSFNKSVFDYTVIMHAGSDSWEDYGTYDIRGGLVISASTNDITNSTFTNNEGYGIVDMDSRLVTFSGNDLRDNSLPVMCDLHAADVIANSDFLFDGYDGDQPIISIKGGDYGTEYNLIKLRSNAADLDYLFHNFTQVNGNVTLNISPGVNVNFEEDGELNIYRYGTLNAIGTSLDEIIFSGNSTTAGYWKGITAVSLSGITLDYVTINYGGGDDNGCLNLGTSLSGSVTNSNMLNGGSYDVFLLNSPTDELDVQNSANNNTYSTIN